jgi:CDP-diacylglycerol--glycerol-3-phosphate 3-phosphatidyltransferase/archaetidylinositol phosphate synthase
MLGKLRERYENLVSPFGEALVQAGITSNMMSLTALFVGFASGWAYSIKLILLGVSLLVLSAMLDMLDGAVARASETSPFGAVLDHVLDRYVEYLVVTGIILGGFVDWFWGSFCVFGMIMASYVRAKAESVGKLDNCSVGLAERQEKLLAIIAGSLMTTLIPSALFYSLILVALISQVTVVQRLWYAHTKIRGR